MMFNQEFYNRMNISSFLLEIMTVFMVMADATNNDLMNELQKQDREYLEKIIQNQEKILEKLAQLESK